MNAVPSFPPNIYSYMGSSAVPSSYLKVIPDNTRVTFYWVILIETVFAIITNGLAVRSIIKRKWKFMKKTCLICLALTDMLTITITAICNLEALSNQLLIWTLGEFMCYFVQMARVFGTTTSSLVLLIIALDRYQTINFGKSWNPEKFVCILSAIMLIFICAVLSYPMFTFYDYHALIIMDDSSPPPPQPIFQRVYICSAFKKELIATYYLIMAILIFVPTIVIFVWFYFNVASLIWKHRKPVGTSYVLRSEEFSSSSSCNISAGQPAHLNPKKDIQLKKIRTFRIVVILMVCFILCRLPYWMYFALKLLVKISGAAGGYTVSYTLLSLHLLDCLLDPLLYTFLNETVNAFKIFNDFVSKVFCCCCSNGDFEEFEKDNPFETYAGGHKRESNGVNLNPNYKVTFLEKSSSNPAGIDKYIPK